MTNITKKDLCENISSPTGLTRVDVKMVIETFLHEIRQSLMNGNNIEIRGFGRFKIKKKNSRNARNPRTGEIVRVEAGYKPVFQASRKLVKRMKPADKT